MSIDKNFIGVIFTALLFAIAPLYTSFFTDKKMIEWFDVAKKPVNKAKNWPQIKVFYEDELIVDGTFFTLEFVNTGKIDIAKTHFDGPIEVELNKSDIVCGIQVFNKSPEDLSVNVKITDEGINIEPLIMNAGDRFSVEILGTEDFKIKKVRGRIVGIKELKEGGRDISGIYLNKILSDGPGRAIPGRAIQKTILHIHPVGIAFGLIVFSAVGFIIVRLHKLVSSTYVKTLIWGLVSSCYLSVIVAGILLMYTYVESYDLVFWGTLFSIFVAICLGYGAAQLVIKSIEKNANGNIQLRINASN